MEPTGGQKQEKVLQEEVPGLAFALRSPAYCKACVLKEYYFGFRYSDSIINLDFSGKATAECRMGKF